MKKAKLTACLRFVSVSNCLISSDCVNGISLFRFLVNQGCLIALSAVYLSIGYGLHNFKKKSLAKLENY